MGNPDRPNLKATHLGKRELFHLHGRLGPDRPAESSRIVLTSRDFDDAYNPRTSRLPAFVQHILLDNNVCLIGSNPAEPHLKRLFKIYEVVKLGEHDLRDPQSPNWFLLWGGDQDPPQAVVECGIHIVPYLKVDDRFTGLDEILEYWAEKTAPVVIRPGIETSLYLTDVEPER